MADPKPTAPDDVKALLDDIRALEQRAYDVFRKQDMDNRGSQHMPALERAAAHLTTALDTLAAAIEGDDDGRAEN